MDPRFTQGLRVRLASLCMLLALTCMAQGATRQDATVRLTLWNQFIGEPISGTIRAIVNDYNAQHPDVFVEVLDVPTMEQKFLTAVAGRVPPSVAIFDRFRIGGYAHRGAFMELDELAREAGIRQEHFFEAPWDECIYDGKLYGVSYNTDVRVLYYNKQAFREAGLDPERPPKTWEELREYSRRLTRRDANGRLTQLGFVPYLEFGNTWLYLFGWQKGATYLSEDGRHATLDHPKLVEALEWTRDFIADYGLNDLRIFQSGFGVREQAPFLVGSLTMVGDEVWLLSRIRRYTPDLDFGVARLPWPKDGQPATWSGGFALVIPTGCEHPEEAAEFIAYMTSAEAQARFGQTAEQLPANRKAVEIPFYQDDPVWRVFVAEMEHSFHRPTTPVGGIMWDEMRRAWEYGAAGQVPPKEALETAQQRVQAELDKIFSAEERPEVHWLPVGIGFFFLVGGAMLWRGVHSARKIRGLSLERKEALAGYVFALPIILGLLIFWVGPVTVTLIYSLCNYDILSAPRWIGVGNYERLLFQDPLFWTSIYNTFYYTIFAVPVSVLGALGLALLLNAPIAGRSIWRTVFYLPSIVPLVALSLLFLWLFNGEIGLFNVILKGIGLPPVPWLSSTRTAKLSLVMMNFWTVGAGMIIFLAGLQGIPRHLYESAVIDGANGWQRFLNVTVPMLSPTIFFMVLMNTIGSFQIFAQAYLMTDGQGSPLDSTLFYVFYLFRQGFDYFNMGYASALAWIMFLIILAVTFLQFAAAKRWVYQEGDR